MKIFISYASARREVAQPLCHALEADGHDVFMDRTDLPAGESYHDRLREAIAGCDRYVFLISPESVRPGSYALTELGLAQARWPRPSGRVLPVMAAPTPFADLPPYLAAVTVLQPKGNLAAEVAAQFSRRRGIPGAPALWIAAAALLAGALGGGWWWQHRTAQEAARQAALAQLADATRSAGDLCRAGSYAAAWSSFEDLLTRADAAAVVQPAQADCAMAWLRGLSRGEGETFSQNVDKLLPVLARELSGAAGQRLGDLHAHIGWGEYLRWRDGRPADPLPHYERALQADPANPYANSMMAHRIAARSGTMAEVQRLFDKGLASERETGFVRSMQIAVAFNHSDKFALALRAVDQAREKGEPLPEGARRVYQRWCESLRQASDRAQLLPVLGTDDALATLAWIQPVKDLPPERRPLWHLCQATLLAYGDRRDQARQVVEGVLARLDAGQRGGSYERWARQQLDALGGPQRPE